MPTIFVLLEKFGPLVLQLFVAMRGIIRRDAAAPNMPAMETDMPTNSTNSINSINSINETSQENPVKFFSAHEFACRCGRGPDCDAVPMDPEFLMKLEALRSAWGLPLVVSSGARCRFWNESVGGVDSSQHLLGKAADLLVRNRKEAKTLALCAEKVGLLGIGVARGFIHVDDGPRRKWTYP